MKKLLHVFFALTLGLLIAGCAKEYDDTELKGQVDKLTQEVNTLKANQQAMQAIIDVWKAGGYIQSIDNSVPGQHTITFYGENGKTVVLYDGAQGPQGEQGPKGENGDSFFKSVTADETGVTFEKVDGTKIFIPFAKAFKLVIENPEAEVEAGKDVEFTYSVQNANATTSVDVFAGGNYAAVVKEADKKIVVTAPTPVVNGSVLAWAQNDEGLFSMKKLNFVVKAETTVTTTAEEYQGIPADAGSFDVAVVSNVDIEVPAPDVDWVTVAVTKANYKITLTLKENTTGAPRETVLKINRADNGKQVQEIKIVQLSTYAAVPTILWAEDWTVETDGILLENYAFTGTTVFSDCKVKYSAVKPQGGSDIKVYLDTQMGGADAQGNLLLSKNGGTWTVSGIPSGSATAVSLTFKTNAKDRFSGLTTTTEGVTIGEMVAPKETSKPYTYGYDITLAAGVKKFDLTFTCSAGSNVRLDDIVLLTYDEVVAPEKELAIKTVFAKNSTDTEAWNAYYGGTGGTDRNIAMDDEYVYIAESAATAKLWAISVADPTKVKAVNVEGVTDGGAHLLTCPRVIKNTDANVNGGKDVLICCSLTRGGVDPKLYMWVNGIDSAPKAITLTTWATDNWYGDTFTVWGTLQDGVLLFDKTDEKGNGVVTFILNGVPTKDVMYLVGRIKTVDAFGSHTGVCAFYPTPDGTAGVYSPGRGTEARGQFGTLGSSLKSEGGINVTLTPLDYDEGTNGFVLGYNFVEWEGNRYVIYGNYKDKKTGYVRVRQGALTDEWSKVASTGKRLYRRDLASGGLQSGNSAMDITARVINGELYIAAQMQNVGFGLYKLCYE